MAAFPLYFTFPANNPVWAWMIYKNDQQHKASFHNQYRWPLKLWAYGDDTLTEWYFNKKYEIFNILLGHTGYIDIILLRTAN